MESENNGGAPAPAETVQPTAPPDGSQVEAVKPADTATQPQEKKEHWASKRIKEISDDRNHWRDLAMRLQQPQQAPATQVSDDEPAKTLKDFNYNDQQFLEYSEKRAVAKADKAAKEAAQRWRAEQIAIERRAKFDERLAAFGRTVEDFDSVVGWLETSAPVSEGMADFLMDSEEAGLVAQYLHDNEGEARKLYQLTPAKAGRELQKLEDRLIAERKKRAEKPVSQAPPPAPRIEAAGDSGRNPDPTSAESDALSDAEWVRLRNKQLQRKRN